ncbi:hypothetical protein L1887_15285 [Cichorium endivia]|nr:hypothetical protein L1887_15285 [Cichorium endivia]
MEAFFSFLALVCLLLLYPYPSSSLPMCTTLRAPVIGNKPLSFCPYKGRVCCDSNKDLELQKQFESMNISDPNCASVIKSIICATCDQFSANLYTVESQTRSVPVLCDSSNSPDSSKVSATSFCKNVWDTCQNIQIQNSPFAPALQGTGGLPKNTSSKLTDLWQSRTDFCTAFGQPLDGKSQCFDGTPIQLNSTEPPVPPRGLCVEKLGDKGYINMAAHPDGSNRAFFSDLPGKIWLATVPSHGSGDPLGLDESSPFVDLTDQVKFDTVFGLMGIAFHPKFVENGRFFASFNCDKEKSATCSGRCGCNSDVGCDPSKIGGSSGGGNEHPCQYHNVVAEYTVNGTASEPKKATKGKPTEVRRIFTMGLPFTNNHGGQILFGPNDGYLYIMLGDGGGRDGPFGFAQNKKSLLGKIMRVDVDTYPKADDLNLWGNYSIPRDNPYSEDKELLPEIWALGLRNPWRCSFDSERPSYFLCTDVGQDRYEEIDIITKGGNYGWNIYEGHLPVNSKGNTTNSTTDLIFPAMGYNHYDVNKKEGSAAITGGYFYRSTTDPCLYGSYLYADLYATALWAAAESPPNSGNFTTTSIPFSCARDSPLECSSVPNSNLAALGYIYSFGEDNQKDLYILASTGVYRVVRPSRCNYSCSKENATQVVNPRGSPPSSGGNSVISKCMEFVGFLALVLYLL